MRDTLVETPKYMKAFSITHSSIMRESILDCPVETVEYKNSTVSAAMSSNLETESFTCP